MAVLNELWTQLDEAKSGYVSRAQYIHWLRQRVTAEQSCSLYGVYEWSTTCVYKVVAVQLDQV